MKAFFKTVFFFFIVIISSCHKDHTQKDNVERFCWQIVDYSGNKVNVICDKTEDELIACIVNGSCPIEREITQFSHCNYYKTGGEKFCWKINNSYIDSCTENEIELISNCYYGGAVPVRTTCIFCEQWYHRQKKTYKPDNTITYSPVTVEQFCGDTTATLFQGRQIIIKHDTDSLIAIQFSNNGINW